MKTPRYSDNRYLHGYRKSTNTDLRSTFRRVREEQKRIAEEQQVKVAPLKRAVK